MRAVNQIIALPGRPSTERTDVAAPGSLFLPLDRGSVRFTELLVDEGQRVAAGQALATDPDTFGVPLLAPLAGVVRLAAAEGHVVLEDVGSGPEGAAAPAAGEAGQGEAGGAARLLALGAWEFLSEAHSGRIPDPAQSPRAVIVSLLGTDCFVAQAEVVLGGDVAAFMRGLQCLAVLAPSIPIHVVMAEKPAGVLEQLEAALEDHPEVQVLREAPVYPAGNAHLAAQRLGLADSLIEPVWALDAQGVLAVERALNEGVPTLTRTFSLAGPAVKHPRHVTAPVGYPLADLFQGELACDAVRVVSGGAMTGNLVAESQPGLDPQCRGLTILPAPPEREFLAFVRPGSDRRSFTRCFLSSLFGKAAHPETAAVRGEVRACVACGYCERACPVDLLPQVLHRCLYAGQFDEAAALGLGACIECGLCSYVCPSKLELRNELKAARHHLRMEAAEALATAARARESAD